MHVTTIPVRSAKKKDFWYHFSALKIPNMEKGGRWDLFEKAANASRIPWNGSEALKFIQDSPRGISLAHLRSSLPAPCPLFRVWGRSTCRVEFVLQPSQRDPNDPQPTISKR